MIVLRAHLGIVANVLCDLLKEDLELVVRQWAHSFELQLRDAQRPRGNHRRSMCFFRPMTSSKINDVTTCAALCHVAPRRRCAPASGPADGRVYAAAAAV
jgi:hypothetical protein